MYNRRDSRLCKQSGISLNTSHTCIFQTIYNLSALKYIHSFSHSLRCFPYRLHVFAIKFIQYLFTYFLINYLFSNHCFVSMEGTCFVSLLSTKLFSCVMLKFIFFTILWFPVKYSHLRFFSTTYMINRNLNIYQTNNNLFSFNAVTILIKYLVPRSRFSKIRRNQYKTERD